MRRLVPDLRLSALTLATAIWSACPAALSPLEGVWTVTDGGTTLACDGGTVTQAVTGVIVAIDDGHRDLTVSIQGQTEEFELSADSAAAGQKTLNLTDDAGFPDQRTVSLDSDSLSLNGTTLVESANGSEEQADGSICTFSRQLTAIRDPP